MATNYEHLEIWKESMNLAEKIYMITKKFPKEEIFGVTSQLRRAVSSISANVAEGSGRKSKKEFSQFVSIAYGSLCEVENFVELSRRLDYISSTEQEEIVEKTTMLGKKLNAFRNYLQK